LRHEQSRWNIDQDVAAARLQRQKDMRGPPIAGAEFHDGSDFPPIQIRMQNRVVLDQGIGEVLGNQFAIPHHLQWIAFQRLDQAI
jgi:hypothetical protein